MPNNFSTAVFFGNTLRDYSMWFLIFIAGLFAAYIFKRIVVMRLEKWAERTETKIDDFIVLHIRRTLMPVIYFGVFLLSARALVLPAVFHKIVSLAWMVLATLLGVRFLIEAIDFGVHEYLLKKGSDQNKIKGVNTILFILKAAIALFALFILLDNVGIKVSALIAGLGVGGIAVALAAQAFLGDIFSFITILFDRPFEVGDFIVFGSEAGTVEHVGIKTTRIRSIGGDQIVVSNTNLTNALVHNHKRMHQRRVVLKLGVTYQTPKEQLKEIPSALKAIIEGVKETQFDRAHFSSFGDSSLNFELVYFVQNGDYYKYMDIQQDINYKIFDEFSKRKIDFAYPTQTLFVSK